MTVLQILENRKSPIHISVIAKRIGINGRTVRKHIQALKTEGHLIIGSSNGVQIVNSTREFDNCPAVKVAKSTLGTIGRMKKSFAKRNNYVL